MYQEQITQNVYVGLEFLTKVDVKIVSSHVIPCSPVGIYERFLAACCFHPQFREGRIAVRNVSMFVPDAASQKTVLILRCHLYRHVLPEAFVCCELN
jgi:hypothetical protein